MRPRTFLLTAALLALGIQARAAVLYLKDGSRIRGTIVSATARDLEVYTEGGTLRVDTDRILRVDYSEHETPPAPAQPAPAPPPGWRARPPEPAREGLEGQQLFSIGLGLAAPLSSVDFSAIGGGSGVNGDPGFRFDAQYLYYTSPRLGVGLGLDYFNRSATSSQNLLPNSEANVSGDSLLLLALLKYSLTDRGWARPYVLGGAGAHRTSTTIDATPNPGFAWSDTLTAETRRLVDDSVWGVAATARAGIDFNLEAPWVLMFEVGWSGLENGRYGATAAGQALGLNSVTGPINVLTVAGRWGWRF